MNENWRRLKPTDVAKWINFGGVKGKWTYSPDQPVDMAALQTEGVAHLWNVLSRNPVALLADEVGMGKTFEALGVAALLWRRKPDAKILVIAPNRDICAHWQREFSAFTRDIYLKADDFVKAKNDGKPAPPFGVHYRLHELTEAIEQRSEHDTPAQFYITTIHALSGLVDSSNESTDKTAAARRAARELHRRIMAASEGAGFDLMIVDEAHYFRNRRGGSQRVAAAEEFFGKPEKPIAQRTLLLTATPSHTRLGDVASILGYFLHRSALEEKTVDELMRKYALRRFRRMEGQGISYTKHQYRREIATPCQFGDSSQDEMFFALYQKLLIKRGVVNEEKRRALYGYLEGFESAGYVEGAQEETQGGAEEDERSKDFRAAADTKLLQDMSSDFRRLFGTAPDHPKYDGIVKICAPQNLFEMPQERHLHEDKHLVFVRRIPSVRELTKRINERYDDLLAQHIADALGWDEETYRRWKGSNWSREAFNEIAKSGDSRDPDSDDDPIDEAEGAGESADEHDYLRSRIADLFVTKKASDGRPPAPPTDCSRFSLSLRKTTSIFSMLLEPAPDYLAGAYPWYYHFIQGGKQRMDFAKAAQMLRMEAWSKSPRETLDNLRPHDADQRDYDEPLETIWSVVFHHLPESEKATLSRWATASPRIAENFANYLKAGFLFASPVIVELYGWHATFDKGLSGEKKHSNVQRRYRKFVDYVRQRIESSLLLKYFTSALRTFEQLCTKIIDHEVDAWDKGWRTLTTLSSPAWYASGESSHRQHLILGFNSPFYPNTLIATSVFQEGVNLHLQCRKVHHYGIAWTPGDNEQRVGRVDRLFGKVNSLLREHGPGEGALEINYPYLKDSFDEDQIGSFIERKYEVEAKMDRCAQGAFDKEIRLMRSGWEAFLRTPTQNETLSDPYPAAFTKD